jgi:hypothetical protein
VHGVRCQQRHVEYGYGRVPQGGVWKQERIFCKLVAMQMHMQVNACTHPHSEKSEGRQHQK